MPVRSLLVAALSAAALTATSAPAFAAPPANDNYLASTEINEPGTNLGSHFQDPNAADPVLDTSEATTQSDLFNPGPNGLPLGGAGPEPLQCGSTTFGKTVWWDFHPKYDGGVEIRTAGFDSVVAVYEWDASTDPGDPNASKITKMVDCQDTAGITEDMILRAPTIKGGHAYTVQVGGVAGPGGVIAGGPLQFDLDYFADRDDDGVLDALDACRTVPGPEKYAGCPPPLSVSPLINFDKLPGVGIRIQALAVSHVPKGARVTARCGGCRTATTVARHSTVQFKSLVGRVVKKGSKVQIQVTLGRTGKGRFKYGATGSLFTWPVVSGNVKPKVTQCLQVKTNKIQKCR